MDKNQAFTILAKAGGTRAARVIVDNTKNLNRCRVWLIARALKRGMPVAKIIHKKWFYGLAFYTNKNTLDPRPDTETLVAAVIADNPHKPRILDLGTGTGCIISALVKNINMASGIGVDKSRGAIKVARRNIKNLGISDVVEIVRGSFENPNLTLEKFDIIVSNPPYIAFGDKRVDTGAKHDPKIALYADNDGFGAYYSIAKNAPRWIKPNGKIYVEIGIDEDTKVRQIFESNRWQYVRDERDLAGITRVLVFKPCI